MPNRPLSPIRWLAALGLTALAAPRALADSFSRGKPSSQQFGVQVARADAIGHTKTDRFPAVMASRVRLNLTGQRRRVAHPRVPVVRHGRCRALNPPVCATHRPHLGVRRARPFSHRGEGCV
ncbi:hypothetical protein [Xanthomonas bonasiae]|uniref:hypothetical protein n=1 Tax=Xanthomonas bonasiae TaxID=2810351 RepID=UPI00177F7BD4|nr:hypothetical protein [Xanthomonas surreyensis]MBD7920903.1 hypothetical protein [Xanthomonas surreyensis]